MDPEQQDSMEASQEEECCGWRTILTDAREFVGKAFDQAEEFTRRRPRAGLAAAFLLGLWIGKRK